MSTRKIHMKNAREVLRVINMGKSIRETAKLAGVSRTATTRVTEQAGKSGLSIESLLRLNDNDLNRIIYPPVEYPDSRHSRLKGQTPDILKALGHKHETLQHQWEIYITYDSAGYSYPQFCHHIHAARQAEIKTCAVMNYKYGDMMFIDFAGDPVSYTGLNGKEVKVKMFVAVLPASQYTYGGLSMNETTEEWIEQSTRALEYFDGVPAAIIPDCARSVVKKAGKYESEINHQYQKFAEHYSTTVVPARPYSPRDKALVENSINNIYRYIYPRLRARNCMSFEELSEAFSELLQIYNSREMRRFRRSRTELFSENERKALTPLSFRRYLFQKFQPPRKVGAMSHIYLKEDQHYYSVPYRFSGRKCEIYYTHSTVKIYCDNERVCIHPREKGIGRYTTDTSQLSQGIKKYLEWEPERARQQAFEYHPAVAKVVDNIFNEQAHHLQARKSIYGLFDLAKKYRHKRFVAACKIAVRKGIARYGVIRNILERGYDKSERSQLAFEYSEVIHENIRYTKLEENHDRTNNNQNEVA